MRGWVGLVVLIGKFKCSNLLASLTSGAMMIRLGSSVAGRGCGGFVDVARLLEAMAASGRLGYAIRSYPTVLLTF